jgi:hypothetical protein
VQEQQAEEQVEETEGEEEEQAKGKASARNGLQIVTAPEELVRGGARSNSTGSSSSSSSESSSTGSSSESSSTGSSSSSSSGSSSSGKYNNRRKTTNRFKVEEVSEIEELAKTSAASAASAAPAASLSEREAINVLIEYYSQPEVDDSNFDEGVEQLQLMGAHDVISGLKKERKKSLAVFERKQSLAIQSQGRHGSIITAASPRSVHSMSSHQRHNSVAHTPPRHPGGHLNSPRHESMAAAYGSPGQSGGPRHQSMAAAYGSSQQSPSPARQSDAAMVVIDHFSNINLPISEYEEGIDMLMTTGRHDLIDQIEQNRAVAATRTAARRVSAPNAFEPKQPLQLPSPIPLQLNAPPPFITPTISPVITGEVAHAEGAAVAVTNALRRQTVHQIETTNQQVAQVMESQQQQEKQQQLLQLQTAQQTQQNKQQEHQSMMLRQQQKMLLEQQQELQRMHEQMDRLKNKGTKPAKPAVFTGGVRTPTKKAPTKSRGLQDITSSDSSGSSSDSSISSDEDGREEERRRRQREARVRRRRNSSSSDEEPKKEERVMTIAERQRQREREQRVGREGEEEKDDEKRDTSSQRGRELQPQTQQSRNRSPSVFGGIRRKASALLRSPKNLDKGGGGQGSGGSPLVNLSAQSRARAMSAAAEGPRQQSSTGTMATRDLHAEVEEEPEKKVEYRNTMFRHGQDGGQAKPDSNASTEDDKNEEGQAGAGVAPTNSRIEKTPSAAARARKKSTKEQKQAAKMVSSADHITWFHLLILSFVIFLQVLVNYFSDPALPKAEYDAGIERLNASGQHDVVMQIEAALQQADKAAEIKEEKNSGMEYYTAISAKGRGVGRKVGVVVVIGGECNLLIYSFFFFVQASNRRSSLVMQRARSNSRARRDSLTGGGGDGGDDEEEQDDHG